MFGTVFVSLVIATIVNFPLIKYDRSFKRESMVARKKM